MPTTLEKQLNIWTAQEKLSEVDSERQLELKLKVLRDQYIDQIIFDYKLGQRVDPQSKKVAKGQAKAPLGNHKKNKCVIL